MARREISAFNALLEDADPDHVAFMLTFLGKVESFFREQLEGVAR